MFAFNHMDKYGIKIKTHIIIILKLAICFYFLYIKACKFWRHCKDERPGKQTARL